MLSNVGILADKPAKIWYATRYKSNRATYTDGTCNKAHYCKKKQCLAKVCDFYLTLKMAC